eukprot:9483908-Pyramimonas_sp.AAC.1
MPIPSPMRQPLLRADQRGSVSESPVSNADSLYGGSLDKLFSSPLAGSMGRSSIGFGGHFGRWCSEDTQQATAPLPRSGNAGQSNNRNSLDIRSGFDTGGDGTPNSRKSVPGVSTPSPSSLTPTCSESGRQLAQHVQVSFGGDAFAETFTVDLDEEDPSPVPEAIVTGIPPKVNIFSLHAILSASSETPIPASSIALTLTSLGGRGGPPSAMFPPL